MSAAGVADTHLKENRTVKHFAHSTEKTEQPK